MLSSAPEALALLDMLLTKAVAVTNQQAKSA
jgi:hypothetical protein